MLGDSTSFNILLDWNNIHVYTYRSSNTDHLDSISRHKLHNSITFTVNCIYLPAFSFVCQSGMNRIKLVYYPACLLSP